MTIAERIQLAKLGYTKEEIKALADEEKAQPPQDPKQQEQPPQDPKQQEQQPTTAATLIAAIDKLTAAMQASNIQNSGTPGDPKQPETVDDILKSIL